MYTTAITKYIRLNVNVHDNKMIFVYFSRFYVYNNTCHNKMARTRTSIKKKILFPTRSPLNNFNVY